MEHNEVTILMLISRWRISLLLLMLLTSCSAQSTYYVTPTPDTPCPGEHCHTLSEYVAGQYFNNLPANTTMEFLPGNHTLEQTISVTNLPQLALCGASASLPEVTSRIECTQPAGFIFVGITELHISSLEFISCSHGRAAVNIFSVSQSNVSNCLFQSNVNTNFLGYHYGPGHNQGNGSGGALYIQNSYVILTANKFQHNSAARGGALFMDTSNSSINGNTFEYNTAGIIYRSYRRALALETSTLSQKFPVAMNFWGGALYVQFSSVNLTGNTFQYNFANMQGGAFYMDTSKSIVTGNTFQNNSADIGGALYIEDSTLNFTANMFQYNSAKANGGVLKVWNGTLNITGNTFQNNSADSAGGAFYVYVSTINLMGNTFQYHSADDDGGALYVYGSILHFIENKFQKNFAALGGTLHMYTSNVTFTDDCFTESYAQLGGAILATDNSIVKMYNITIENNKAQYGGGMAAVDGQLEVLENTFFENNRARYGGGLYVHNTEFHGNAIFTENSVTEGGGGIYASRSTLFVADNTTIITNNSAMDGGGLLLSGDSKLYQQPGIAIHFISNSARSTGGAIKVEESNPLTYCITTERNFDVSNSECFFQIQQIMIQTLKSFSVFQTVIDSLSVSHTMRFDNNTAVEAGADLYGGSVDNCTLNNFKFSPNYYGSRAISGYLFDVITESNSAITSNPLHICTCRNSLTNCTGTYNPGPVYPGGTLEIPLIALGQRNGTNAAVIQVVHTTNSIKLTSLEYSQNIDNSCNIVKYTILSHAVGTAQEMTLYAQGPCSPTQNNTITVTVIIQHCAPGFQLSSNEPICICADRLQHFTNTCLVDNATVLRVHNAVFWVGYDSQSQGLILHPNCPFDYCISEETYLAVQDSDKQCNYNRSGLLCGRCSENLSLVLGSSRCLRCSNSYLSLLAAFTFAGIALVLLLLVLRLTVAAGTINGLVFYANIVAVNSAIFFRPQNGNVPTGMIANVLSVFIAWLNLDLGIGTCFYNGMDAYAKTWMQFAFPLYVWALVGMIIVGSYYSGRVVSVFGSNPIAVLATLFLLSYAKLLRTVFAAISYTSLEYPNNSQIAVWLYDGNIRYFSGRHTLLFTAAIVCLIFLFLPYTVLLIFSQCLQAKSGLKIFSCINSRYVKPFLDAYHAPYTNKHRYWTGLMLLLRFVLFLISAVDVLGNPSVNLLAIASITVAILTLPTILGSRMYKTWSLGILEVSFIVNLTILAVATLYIRLTRGNQNIATFTSVGIAFATFTGIVIYHSVQQIKSTRLWRRVCLRQDTIRVRVPLNDVWSGPEDPPDYVLMSRSGPTRTVVDMRELREPCMATD